jgi:hypothetical protein
MKKMCNIQSIKFPNLRTLLINFSILGLFLFQLNSCANKGGAEGGTEEGTGAKSQRFSKDLDTSYKDNSTEIESITRTFYKYEDGSKSAKLSQVLGDTSYAFAITNGSDYSVTIFYNKEIKKFFEDLRTVANNPKKQLNYKFGGLQEGSISLLGEELNLFLPPVTATAKSVSLYIKKSEIDSLESCYKRYSTEKTKK